MFHLAARSPCVYGRRVGPIVGGALGRSIGASRTNRWTPGGRRPPRWWALAAAAAAILGDLRVERLRGPGTGGALSQQLAARLRRPAAQLRGERRSLRRSCRLRLARRGLHARRQPDSRPCWDSTSHRRDAPRRGRADTRGPGSRAAARQGQPFVGSRDDWRTNIPTYSRVLYEDVYDGIDVAYHGNQGPLEYDFVVAPGADPEQIELRFDGVEASSEPATATSASRRQRMRSGSSLRRPISTANGGRQPVGSKFVVGDDGAVSFALGDYDSDRELVIDPVLQYSTYLGGTERRLRRRHRRRRGRQAYVTGRTGSTNFPTQVPSRRPGAGSRCLRDQVQPHRGAARLLDLSRRQCSGDIGEGIAVDSATPIPNAYVTGQTYSSNFPTAAGVHDTANTAGSPDAFVTK